MHNRRSASSPSGARPVIEAADAVHRSDPGSRSSRRRASSVTRRIASGSGSGRSGRSGKWRKSTIRQYVRERKRELGWSTRTTCVPQSYTPGQEGQVDWYEAWAELNGEQVKLQVFAMRSMASGAAFHRAYQRATQQAFLEAHEHAFHYFGGVFRLLRYDNLKSCGEEDPARPSARGDDALHRLPLALALRERLLHTRRNPTKKAESKVRPATFGAITGCRCRRRGISRSSTRSCWPPVAKTSSARSPDTVSRWERR